jgi:hypothetical protein
VPTPSVASILGSLPKGRILETARLLDLQLPAGPTKAELAQRVAAVPTITLRHLLPLLRRDELRAACRDHALSDAARARAELIDQLILAAGEPALPRPVHRPSDDLPQPDDLVVVRQRQYLVEAVTPSADLGRPGVPQATRVSLVCLDDDAQGRPLEVLWELELGARIIQPGRQGLGTPEHLDAPPAFRAYLHALRWQCVTATNAQLFQAPFRAGIHILDHQLTPLAKALALPRANLFIADDVGLGKTIEAGLVVQELLLRQRVDTVLVVCPPSIALQWQDELLARFGLHFEIYDRDFVGRRRAERGFAVNPWSTHNRFIISYQTLRRPEHQEPLLQHLGAVARRSLLILDEAHTVAPASASKYAVDSALTTVVRDVAPRFENRLFLSATPHNGHSNSFAALLEILDPQRFTRGIPVTDPRRLEPVMVRRLKSDLEPLKVAAFPVRVVQRWRLDHHAGHWQLTPTTRRPTTEEETGPAIDLGPSSAPELVLAEKLARYTALMETGKGVGRLVFINLQKRLLSSVAAFFRTFSAHCAGLTDTPLPGPLPQPSLDDVRGDDEAADEADEGRARLGSAGLTDPSAEAATLRHALLTLAKSARHQPDARIHALVDWIRRHQCPGVAIGGALMAPRNHRVWSDRRLIIFTEYFDTLRALEQQLTAHLAGTDQAEQRVMRFHGGMTDEARAEVRRAFNSTPADHPVRILLATDAAREGINLQAACADLIHFDIPWNPARLEQRNGRIDRTLQPEAEVRCTYFVYPQRPADAVLDALVRKVDVIRRELGSVGSVVLDRIEETLADGIRADTATRLDAAAADQQGEQTARAELETQRTQERLNAEINQARKILDASAKVIAFEPDALREVIDIGLGFLGAPPLTAIDIVDDHHTKLTAWGLPPLPLDWQGTLDTLRPPRPQGMAPWEWRRQCTPLPVVFRPAPRLTSPVVHLHLEHPFVRRILSRFRAQGFAAHDLSRASLFGTPHERTPHVVALGRVSLFGPGASRLHDELIAVSAPWLEGSGAGTPEPDTATRTRLDRLLREAPHPAPAGQATRLRAHVATDAARLWPHVEAEAEARADDARLLLDARARTEQAALRTLLIDQRAAIEARVRQMSFDFVQDWSADQRRQFQDDRTHMERRLLEIDREIETEPTALAALYATRRARVEPVGLLYLWPVT